MNEEKIYFYLDKNRLPKGPVSVEELKQLSTISDVVYCHAGDSEWKKFETNPPSGTSHTEKNLPTPSPQEPSATPTVVSPTPQTGSTISPRGIDDKPDHCSENKPFISSNILIILIWLCMVGGMGIIMIKAIKDHNMEEAARKKERLEYLNSKNIFTSTFRIIKRPLPPLHPLPDIISDVISYKTLHDDMSLISVNTQISGTRP